MSQRLLERIAEVTKKREAPTAFIPVVPDNLDYDYQVYMDPTEREPFWETMERDYPDTAREVMDRLYRRNM